MPTYFTIKVVSITLRNIIITTLSAIFCFGFVAYSMAFAGEVEDISGHWAALEIEQAISAGYVRGYPDGRFRPDAGVTRAEFVAMVDSAFQVAAQQGQPALKDVRARDWFAKDVQSAVAAGFVSGYPNGTFQPQRDVSRQEAACMLAALLKLGGQGYSTFSDAGEIDGWATPSVFRLADREIMAGYSNSTFRPQKIISRAEAVVMINKAILYRSQTPVTCQLKVTGDSVNVRSGPNQNELVIGQVHSGEILQAKAKSSDDWYQIAFEEGSGWIAGWYVQVNQPSEAPNQPSLPTNQNTTSSSGGRQQPVTPTNKNAADNTALYYGMDVSQYPGDDLMQAWWNDSPFYYTGFYLAPTWQHPDTSWMDKRQVLVNQGWGFMPIYVGLQAGSSNLNAAAGAADADEAVNLAASAGFPSQTTIFLDVETSFPLTGDYLAYINAWANEVQSKNMGNRSYKAGIYCYVGNADQIRNALSGDAEFWVASWLAHDTAYSLPSPMLNPADSGASVAHEWQFVGEDSITYGGYPIIVDASTSIYSDPSMPSRNTVNK